MISLKKISVAIASGAVLLGTVAGNTYASSITISGNGAFSDNSVDFSSERSTTVVQSNSMDINNNVSVSNNTGNNSSGFNTGGDTTIRTGDATSEVTIVNEGNTNIANLSDCGCHDSTHISIHGNGAFSDNEVDVDTSHRTVVVQENDSDIDNNVDVNNNTGNNGSSHFGGFGFREHPDFDKDNYDKKDHRDYDREKDGYGHDFDFNKDHAKYDFDKDHDKKYGSKDYQKHDFGKDHYNFGRDKDKFKSYNDKDHYDFDKNKDYDKSYDKKDHYKSDSKNDHYGDYDRDKKFSKSYSDKDHYYPVMKKVYYRPDYEKERLAYYIWLKKHLEYRKLLSKNHYDNDWFWKNKSSHSKNNFKKFGGYPSGHFGGGYNTGGDTNITTGDARSVVSIHNAGSQNILH